jgi:hypothetical protein
MRATIYVASGDGKLAFGALKLAGRMAQGDRRVMAGHD